MIVPTLLDWARICSVVKMPPGSLLLLWIVRSATWIVSPSSNFVSGCTTWSPSAPATVNGLKVEPGS